MQKVLIIAIILAAGLNSFAGNEAVSVKELTPEQSYNIFNKQYGNLESLDRQILLKAEKHIDALIGTGPEADLYFRKAVIEDRLDNKDNAISAYSAAIELEPSNSKYYSNRGLLYQQKGSLEESLNDLHKAVELAPAAAFPYYARSLFYIRQNDYKRASEDLKKFFKLNVDKEFEDLARESTCRKMMINGYEIEGCPSLGEYTIVKGAADLDDKHGFAGSVPVDKARQETVSKTGCCEWTCTTILTKCCEDWECTDYSPSTGECINWKCNKWVDCLVERCKCKKKCEP